MNATVVHTQILPSSVGTLSLVVKVSEEDTHPEGHFAMGEEEDKAMVADIIRQVSNGNVWAWAYVDVELTLDVDGQRFMGSDGLGCCSYKSFEDFKDNGDLLGMVEEAKANLNTYLESEVKRGEIARSVVGKLPSLKSLNIAL
jgi:hypothetical protein